MDKVYPDTFYMTVYEDFKRKDGSGSLYSRMMFNPSTWKVMDGWRTTRKEELKKKVEENLSRFINLNDFTITETKHGWKYERFVKWLDEEDNYELVEEGQHTDHEAYTVDI
ncbi:hypothetical protein AB6N22_12765, partial [Kocuria palustris]|uniref:hypothetical protein n=1 Tax=Kocuria palustris TaxID=71999 RepID=UPI00399FA47C